MAETLPESLILFKKLLRPKTRGICPATVLLFATWALGGCTGENWNNPYPRADASDAVFYSSFSERPKHLDPARSYSSNEWSFISQIYEPPLQYHFLKRPYALIPQSAADMPEVVVLDAQGRLLPEDTPTDQIAFTEYRINVKPGVKYQPHPAFARTADGYRYWPLSESDLEERFVLSDFEQTDTREMVASDFVYQIKRLAFKPNHSPVAGLMGKHIVGFKAFGEAAAEKHKQTEENGELWTDLRDLDMAGVRVLDRYRYSIRVNKTYPQFIYWLAMNFFAPMPWEAERFYAQPGMAERNISLHWFPVGTGPYMLTENNPNLRMVLTSNPNFRGEAYPSEGSETDREMGLLDDAGKQMPFIKKAIYSLEKEAIPRWNKFLQGYYDNSGIASDSFDQAVQFGAEGEAALTDSMVEKGIQLNTAVETSILHGVQHAR